MEIFRQKCRESSVTNTHISYHLDLIISKRWGSSMVLFCLKIKLYLLSRFILYLRIDCPNLFGSCGKIPDNEGLIWNFIQIYLLPSSDSGRFLYLKLQTWHFPREYFNMHVWKISIIVYMTTLLFHLTELTVIP